MPRERPRRAIFSNLSEQRGEAGGGRLRYTLHIDLLDTEATMFQKLFKRRERRRSEDIKPAMTDSIGTGTRFHGTLTGSGGYLIQGEVVGDGEIEGLVVIAAGASWKGDVLADIVQVAGRVEGHIVARQKIDLGATAVVVGDLTAPLIALAEGASYEGAITKPRKTQVTRYQERRGLDATVTA